MARNQLNCLPPEIGLLASLKTLDFSRNALTKLPNEVGIEPRGERTCCFFLSGVSRGLMIAPITAGSHSLRVYVVPSTALDNAPCLQICVLRDLEVLNVMGNFLDSLPRDIGNLVSLRLLGLKSNRLTTLPPSFR